MIDCFDELQTYPKYILQTRVKVLDLTPPTHTKNSAIPKFLNSANPKTHALTTFPGRGRKRRGIGQDLRGGVAKTISGFVSDLKKSNPRRRG